MATMDDMQLLRDYAEGGSENAFTTLVARHISMVHSVALRHVRDPHQAEEITQVVFIILARKARALPARTILSGWLFHTARLTAANFVRTEIRRTRREQEAYMQSRIRENLTHGSWEQMAPLLDEAIASLNEKDRNAIVLRFIDGRDFKDVGSVLGATEDGVRMRVNRAVEKLQGFMARHGVTLSAAVIAGALSANAVQASPPALLSSVAGAVAGGTSATSSTATLLKGTLKLMAWTKLKIVAVAGIGILLAASMATVVVKVMSPPPTSAVAEKIWELYSKPGTRNAVGRVLEAMDTNPPVTSIETTRLPIGKTQTMSSSAGWISMGTALQDVFNYAYDFGGNFARNRIIVPPDLRAARYDYIDTTRPGGKELLQRELEDQFGLVARLETRQLDTYVMTVNHPDAPGLKKADTMKKDSGGGGMGGNNLTMATLATRLGNLLGVKVMDQSGLSGGFDVKLFLPLKESIEDNKQAVLNQLGLDLNSTPEKHPVEFLVVERVR